MPLDDRWVKHEPLTNVTGNCVFIVRMARDFGLHSLPLRQGGYNPPYRGPKIEVSTWKEILRVGQPIYQTCLHTVEEAQPGWAMISDSIVAAFWPTNSEIDEKYGLRVTYQDESSNVTDIYWS